MMARDIGHFQWMPWRGRDNKPAKPYPCRVDIIMVVLSRGEFFAYETLFRMAYRLSLKTTDWRLLF